MKTYHLFNPIHLFSMMRSPDLFFRKKADPNEKFFIVKTGSFSICILTCPVVAYDVIQGQHKILRHGLGSGKMRKLTGNGVLSSEGPEHVEHRKMMEPMFSRNQIPDWRKTSQQVLEKHLDKILLGETLDFHSVIKKATAEIILQTFFGVSSINQVSEINVLIEELLILFTRPSITRVLFSRKAGIVRQKAAAAFGSLEDAPLFKVFTQNTSDEEKLDHCISLLLAGIDTLAWAFTWTAGLLAHHPEWSKTQDEKEISAIASESLRLYPTVWSIVRNSIAPIQIENELMPSRTRFVAPLTYLHRHPLYWENPESFQPSRFLESTERPRMAYAPFGVGGYSCLGIRMATVVLENFVHQINSKLRLIPVGPMPDTHGSVTLTSRKPLLLKVFHK